MQAKTVSENGQGLTGPSHFKVAMIKQHSEPLTYLKSVVCGSSITVEKRCEIGPKPSELLLFV